LAATARDRLKLGLVIGFLAVLVLGIAGALRLRGREMLLRARIVVANAGRGSSSVDEVERILTERIDILARLHGVSRWRLSRAREGGAGRQGGSPAATGEETEDAVAFDLVLAGYPVEGLRRFARTLVLPGKADFHRVATNEERKAAGDASPGCFVAAVERKNRWSLRKVGDVDVEEEHHLLWREPLLSVSRFEKAEFHTEGLVPQENVIDLELAPEDAGRFGEITRANVGRRLALVVDGVVRTVALIDSPAREGKVQLRGMKDRKAAKLLARLLAVGALPRPCKLVGLEPSAPGPPKHRSRQANEPRPRGPGPADGAPSR
jgi:hypothetical protein